MTTKTDLLQQLAESRAYVDAVLDRVGNRWGWRVYGDDSAWNARDVLIHIATADEGQTKTVMAIAQGENPIPADFDVNRYNRRMQEKRAEMTVEQARELMRENRAKLNTWIENALTDAMLAKVGRHATLQEMTIEQFLQTIATHERNHASDIAYSLKIDIDKDETEATA